MPKEGRGERTLLYILVVVLILAGLLFLLSQNAKAQTIGKNILGNIGQSSLNIYHRLAAFGNNFVGEKLEKKLEENRKVAADQGPGQKFEFKAGLPHPKMKREAISLKTEEIEDAVYRQLDLERVRLSTNKNISAIIKSGKYIDIDISSQTLTLFENGKKKGAYPVSSGSPIHPTPYGIFKVNSKSPNAYSSEYDLYMPYWMAFIGSSYGIHELPYYPNGYREGAGYLGRAVSHGCVRLGMGAAARVYSWTPVGTPVIVHQ